MRLPSAGGEAIRGKRRPNRWSTVTTDDGKMAKKEDFSATKSGDFGRRRACTSAREGRGRREEGEEAYLRRRRGFSDEKLDGTRTGLREEISGDCRRFAPGFFGRKKGEGSPL